MHVSEFEKLVNELKKLPSVGERTAEEIAFFLFENRKTLKSLVNALLDFSKLNECSVCHTITSSSICDVCSDETRERKLMIVKSPKDMFIIERMGIYKGRYHVLGGVISIVEGIEPSDLHIDDIPRRIENEHINEVIFAIEPTIEGEATMYYIYELLKSMNIKITQIARGIPTGYDISHIDEITLEKAITQRQPLK